MNIRSRLTLRFILIDAAIFLIASVLIYIFSADFRDEDFRDRLRNKATNTAKLLIEVDEVSADLLRRLEKDNPVSLPNEKIIIFDFHNEKLFSTDEEQIIKCDKNLLDRVRLEQEIHFHQGEYEVLGFLFKGRFDRFVVIAAATDIFGVNKLRNLRNILILVFVISLIIVSIAGWFFAGKALEPISKVVSQVGDITITSLNNRVDEGNGKDEIARLAQTFNKMLTGLETSFKVQKNFIANASHELRTPLTAITGQLEVTLQKQRTNNEYVNSLNSVLDDIKNLNMLSNRLLLLAQTSEANKIRKEPFRIDEMLWDVRDEILRHNPAFNVNINFDEHLDEESDLTIKGDEHLIKTAISNLIENGCKYSENHLTIIHISTSAAGLVLAFTNNGVGIQQQEIPHLFEPFYRGEHTVTIKGHGIGLSMVSSIVKLHGGSIDVKSVPGAFTTFSVCFSNRNI
jgi:signal transduction histidine kinase